ncbi:hypothetical protein JCM5353_000573 [Sporobolomyces roseus]
MTTTPTPFVRLTTKQLQKSPVLTICGVKIGSLLKDYVTIGQAVNAGVITRDRLDTVNFVFIDEAARQNAYMEFDHGLAKEMLKQFAEYDIYLAIRPIARVTFSKLIPIEQPVFNERQRIYLKEEFKPASYYGVPCSSRRHDHRSRREEVAKEEPSLSGEKDVDKTLVAGSSDDLVCPVCRRLYAPIY